MREEQARATQVRKEVRFVGNVLKNIFKGCMDEGYMDEGFYRAEKAYRKGLEDAWNCAKRVCNMNYSELNDAGFVELTSGDLVFDRLSALSTLIQLNDYDEKKKHPDPIKVGDEVKVEGYGKGVVTKCYYSDDQYAVFLKVGIKLLPRDWFTPTGKNFPQMKEMLTQLSDGEYKDTDD